MNSTRELISLMLTFGRIIRERASSRVRIDGLSLEQIKVLAIVSESQLPTMKEVAESLYITQPSATAVINRLVETGQLKRLSDARDRRRVCLAITPRGAGLLKKCQQKITAQINEVLIKKLNHQEKTELLRIFRKITVK